MWRIELKNVVHAHLHILGPPRVTLVSALSSLSCHLSILATPYFRFSYSHCDRSHFRRRLVAHHVLEEGPWAPRSGLVGPVIPAIILAQLVSASPSGYLHFNQVRCATPCRALERSWYWSFPISLLVNTWHADLLTRTRMVRLWQQILNGNMPASWHTGELAAAKSDQPRGRPISRTRPLGARGYG